MDTTLGNQIAQKVIADTAFWVAVIGLVGAIIGSLATIAGNILHHCLQSKPQRQLEKARKKILLQMLDDSRFADRWRKLTTLARVIGADEETTKRLLIDVGARGSENDDGLWGLIKYHPFNDIGSK